MRHLTILSVLTAALPALSAFGQEAHPALVDGVISFTDAGRRIERIQIDKRCADLWVAPDESVIAFITVDQAMSGTENTANPLVVESTIYVARKRDNFRPVRIKVEAVEINGERWAVLRLPSVSPDGRTIYFSVPNTMKDWTLFRTPIHGGNAKMITYESSYCVVWGGRYSGDLLLLKEVYVPRVEGLACFLRDREGETRADVPDCAAAGAFARWSRLRGGDCMEVLPGVNSETTR